MSDKTPTVSIDPNSVYRFDPSLTVAEISDASDPVSPGDTVIVVQEGNGDDPDFVGTGVAAKVDREYGLLHIAVNWDSFQEKEVDPTSKRSPDIRHLLVRDLIAYGLTPAQADELITKAEELGAAAIASTEGST